MAERNGHLFSVSGAWTKAGIASCMKIEGMTSQEHFLFDCGVLNSETLSAGSVFLSHGHIDHSGSCVSHARARSLSYAPAKYYMPVEIVKAMKDAKRAFEQLDDGEIPMEIIGVKPGDVIPFSKNVKAIVFSTTHRVPSQGYAFQVTKRGDLLPEVRTLTSKEIAELCRMGIQIRGPDVQHIEMVYTGDTTMDGLRSSTHADLIFTAKTFITELTYLDRDVSKAVQWGHIHIQDIVDHGYLFEKVERLVFVHLSAKYSYSRALQLLAELLPPQLAAKAYVSLHSFGAKEVLTKVIDDSGGNGGERGGAGWGWSSQHGFAHRHRTKQPQQYPPQSQSQQQYAQDQSYRQQDRNNNSAYSKGSSSSHQYFETIAPPSSTQRQPQFRSEETQRNSSSSSSVRPLPPPTAPIQPPPGLSTEPRDSRSRGDRDEREQNIREYSHFSQLNISSSTTKVGDKRGEAETGKESDEFESSDNDSEDESDDRSHVQDDDDEDKNKKSESEESNEGRSSHQFNQMRWTAGGRGRGWHAREGRGGEGRGRGRGRGRGGRTSFLHRSNNDTIRRNSSKFKRFGNSQGGKLKKSRN